MGSVEITEAELHEVWDNISGILAAPQMLLSPSEAALLYKLAGTVAADGLVVEIGSWFGGSTCALGTACKERKIALVCIDHWGAKMVDTISGFETDIFTYWWRNVRLAELDGVVVPIRGTSEEISKHWCYPIRMLFIDGGHTYEVAKNDWDNYTPYVTVGGIVLIHDSWKDGPYMLCQDIESGPGDIWRKVGKIDSITAYERIALDNKAVRQWP